MKVKVYKVTAKKDGMWYIVDAPNKRIARWCGAACYNSTYAAFLRASDMVAERFRYMETNNDN